MSDEFIPMRCVSCKVAWPKPALDRKTGLCPECYWNSGMKPKIMGE